jgi:hypothetical protein
MKYPLYTVFFSLADDETIAESPDFYELEDALEFFNSVASDFKQINRYDSYESKTKVILQTTASAERSGYGLFV